MQECIVSHTMGIIPTCQAAVHSAWKGGPCGGVNCALVTASHGHHWETSPCLMVLEVRWHQRHIVVFPVAMTTLCY